MALLANYRPTAPTARLVAPDGRLVTTVPLRPGDEKERPIALRWQGRLFEFNFALIFQRLEYREVIDPAQVALTEATCAVRDAGP